MSLPVLLLELESTVRQELSDQRVGRPETLTRFADTRSFLMESESLFREVRETLNAGEQGEEKLRLVEAEFEHLRGSLDRLEAAYGEAKLLVLEERLNGFLSAYRRVTELTQELTQLSSEQPIYSPSPSLDAFIKAALKTLNGDLETSLLEDRFFRILPELGRLERQIGLLPKLHQEGLPEEPFQAAQKALTGLQSGFGALYTYFQDAQTGGQDPMALEDGIKLLGSSSTILADRLQKIEEAVAAQPLYSTFRPFEEWRRLMRYVQESSPTKDELPDAWIEGALVDLMSAWGFLLVKGENLLAHPLLRGVEIPGGLSVDEWPERLQLRIDFETLFSNRNGRAFFEVEEGHWQRLGKELEALHDRLSVSYRALEERVEPFREVPGLETIAILLEQVRTGRASPSLLEAEFEVQLQRVEELIDSVTAGRDPISEEFRELLPLHRLAYLGMSECLQAGDWEGVEARWQGLLATLPAMARLSRSVKNRVARQSSAARQISCLRCQARNEPSRRVCSSCGAQLPAVVQRVESSADLSLGEEGAGPVSARSLDLLEGLVARLEGNQVSKQQAKEALESLVTELNQIRAAFGKKVIPLMGQDQVLDSYLRFFAQGLGAYFAGLMEMLQFCENGQLSSLHSGLSSCRETLEVLEELKVRIDEALRG